MGLAGAPGPAGPTGASGRPGNRGESVRTNSYLYKIDSSHRKISTQHFLSTLIFLFLSSLVPRAPQVLLDLPVQLELEELL